MNYVLNEEKMFADVTDGVAIIINSETGIYYGLNGFGATLVIGGGEIYENIANGASIEEILTAIKSISGAPTDIEERLNDFISKMIKFELIIEAPASSNNVEIDSAIAIEEEFVLDVSEYNDAQELLLADPIHEVKEETGWTPEKDSIGYSKDETAEREKRAE